MRGAEGRCNPEKGTVTGVPGFGAGSSTPNFA